MRVVANRFVRVVAAGVELLLREERESRRRRTLCAGNARKNVVNGSNGVTSLLRVL